MECLLNPLKEPRTARQMRCLWSISIARRAIMSHSAIFVDLPHPSGGWGEGGGGDQQIWRNEEWGERGPPFVWVWDFLGQCHRMVHGFSFRFYVVSINQFRTLYTVLFAVLIIVSLPVKRNLRNLSSNVRMAPLWGCCVRASSAFLCTV